MNVDVAIVGGGPVGGSLARALAPAGLSLALVEARAPRPLPATGFDQRVYALNGHSRRFLERCGIWQRLSPERIAPIREMRVLGDDASKIEFSAYRSGVPELAAIVEEANLQQALWSALSTQANLTLFPGVECVSARWDDAQATLSLSDGRQIEARLVVAADGAESAMRNAAGIATKVHEYGQTGVVANFRAERAHRDTAYQWFLNTGVLAPVLAARGMENDVGAVSLLRRFERSRREDLLAMEAVTDGLQVLFDSNLPGVKRLRNAGLRLVNRISPLKRLLVKRALG